MKKRLLSILTISVLSLSLFACAGKNEPREEPPSVDPSYEEPATEDPEEPMVGMANPWVEPLTSTSSGVQSAKSQISSCLREGL